MLEGALLDVSLLVLMLGAASWGNSLTLLGDAIRGGLLLLLEVCLLILMRRLNRGGLGGFDYGTRKVEQFANLLVGAALILAALSLVAASLMRSAEPVQNATGLLAAWLIGLLNFFINGYVLWRLWQAARGGESVIIGGQVASRLMKTLVSGLVAAIIAVNLAFVGRAEGAMADMVGTFVVVATMILFGGRIIGDALPHLLDHALSEPLQGAINRALASDFEMFEELYAVRTRTEGRDAWIEIELGLDGVHRSAEVSAAAEHLAAQVMQRIPKARVIVIPRLIDIRSIRPARRMQSEVVESRRPKFSTRE